MIKDESGDMLAPSIGQLPAELIQAGGKTFML
jgi:hypothetical protein